MPSPTPPRDPRLPRSTLFTPALAATLLVSAVVASCGRAPQAAPSGAPDAAPPGPTAPASPTAAPPSAVTATATATAIAAADAGVAEHNRDAALRLALQASETTDALATLETALRAGVGHDDLRAALIVAHGRTAAPPAATEQLAALLRLERTRSGSERLAALLILLHRQRADDRRYGARQPIAKAATLPLRRLDEDGLRDHLLASFVAGDGVAVGAALRVMWEEDGQERLSDALITLATAEDGQAGRASIAAVGALRLLEATAYREAGPLLEKVGALLPGGATAQPAAWQRARREAMALPGRFADGAPAPPHPQATSDVRARCAAQRGVGAPAGGDALVEAVRRALAKGAPAQALWDGLILGAHDLAVQGDPPGLALRLTHALRLVGERAPGSAVRALALLQAARRLGDASGAATKAAAAPGQPAVGAAPAVEVQREPDLDALRRRLLARAFDDDTRALAVARIEAAAMLAPDWRADVEEPLHALVLPVGAADPIPEAPHAAAGAALIARLRAGSPR